MQYLVPSCRQLQYRFLTLAAAITLSGCPTSSSEQVCDPISQTGCPTSKTCSIAASGISICVPDTGRLSEGLRCAISDSSLTNEDVDPAALCGPGLGCISYMGVARCLRFCRPNDAANDTTCGQTELTTELRHPLSEFASCSVQVDERPEIGACVLPCAYGRALEADCPDGSHCAIPMAGVMATCLPVGDREAGESCGAGCNCRASLQCVSESSGYVCRHTADVDGACEDAFLGRTLFGTFDPISTEQAAGYAVCTPCLDTGIDGLRLCPNSATCQSDHGRIGQPVVDTAQRLGRTLAQAHFVIDGVVVAAGRNSNGDWHWVNSAELIPIEWWADGHPTPDANCAILGENGQLQGRIECPTSVLCEEDERPQCE